MVTANIEHSKPVLPSVASLLYGNNLSLTNSTTVSPFFETMTTGNSNERRGIVRLPPLCLLRSSQSLESALKHTINLSDILNTENKSTNKRLVIEQDKPLLTSVTPIAENDFKGLNFKYKNSNNTGKYDKNNNVYHGKKSSLNSAQKKLTYSSSDKKRTYSSITHSQDTFGIKEPRTDNASLIRRKRHRTSARELNILQDSFNRCSTPSKEEKIMLAQKCNMSEKAVRIWFQNKRQYLKKQKMKQKTSSSLTVGSRSEENKPVLKIPSPKRISIPQLEISTDAKLDVTPTKKSPKKFLIKKGHSSTIPSNNLKIGQSLTFHIRNEMKCLTPVKNICKNKVSKLINTFSNNQNRINRIEKCKAKTLPIQYSPPSKQRHHASDVLPKKKVKKPQFTQAG